jgi:hypothetical protein
MSSLGLHSSKVRFFTSVLVLLALGATGAGISAQSGRRSVKPSPTTAPGPPAANETPHPITLVEKPLGVGQLANKVRLLVARQHTQKHFQAEDQILASLLKQLNRYENVEAAYLGDTKEAPAIERAKKETDIYVVFLNFEVDNFQSGAIIVNSQDLEVQYSLLTPGTGRKQAKGKVYYQSISGGRVRKSEWPNGAPIKITAEAAGIEVADALHFWLKLADAKAKP